MAITIYCFDRFFCRNRRLAFDKAGEAGDPRFCERNFQSYALRHGNGSHNAVTERYSMKARQKSEAVLSSLLRISSLNLTASRQQEPAMVNARL
jgi:hypothetical protein